MKIEFDEKCKACKGTGLYSGIGEGPGCAVVCHACKGTGCHHFIHEYEEFTARQEAIDIEWVYECNPGIKVGKGSGFSFSNFGGISYAEWENGGVFPAGTENRFYTCPAWWYQSADYKKKPKWKECIVFGAFSSCQHFSQKVLCWNRFDTELID